MLSARVFTSVKRSFQPTAISSLGTTVRGLSDRAWEVEIEHGRGDWKTYGNIGTFKEGKHRITTFNKISPKGLARFDEEKYDVKGGDGGQAVNAHAILLRSHKLQEEEVAHTVRAIARYVFLNLVRQCSFPFFLI